MIETYNMIAGSVTILISIFLLFYLCKPERKERSH